MKTWGIRARVLFLALLPSALILVTLVTYFTYTRIAEVDTALAQHGLSIARQLGPGTEFALFAGDRAALQRLADAAARDSDVARVTITDREGRVLAVSRPLEAAQVRDLVEFTHPVVETRLITTDTPEQMKASGTPAKIGEITVAISRATAYAEQRRLLLIGLALGLGCVLIALALAFIIGNSVIQPIQRLASAMAELSDGKPPVPLTTTGGGEFKTLNEGFNEMAARLHASTRELELRIDEATRELIAQKDAAEQATSAKSRFIAAASHDLRQPLHAIGLFTATLQRRARGADLEPVVRDLAQAVSVMVRLFESLLDISRLDAGTLRAEPQPFRLEPLFTQVLAEYADQAAQKQLRLHVRPTAVVVVTDELLLHRILGNLVANAIRYTRTGSVMVAARLRGAEVQIEVRDSGIGIPIDKQVAIFEEFYQIGNVARDRSQGLGLGLAIVARVAHLLGTQVVVRSALNRGSVFSLRVPRGGEHLIAARYDQARMGSQRPSPLIPVLVVDDDPLVLASNRALLTELGCEVITANNGDAAQAALAAMAGKFVLVLCDLWLSDDQSGIDVLHRLAALTTMSVSGILISGDTRPETIRAAREAGFPLLHKPVSPAKLRAVVTNLAWKMHKKSAADPGDENTAR
jgi:signal transduction histidine kinase/CheY-like chemotaxis protein